MTLVIDLGLERFFYGEPEDAPVELLRVLVEKGLTTRVRDVVAPSQRELDARGCVRSCARRAR